MNELDSFAVTITTSAKWHGRMMPLSSGIKVYPRHEVGAILIIYPGYNSDIDGYNKKYEKIARAVKEKNVAAVVQLENKDQQTVSYELSLLSGLRAALDYVLAHATEICSATVPDIYLMGFSAGAGAVAAVAGDYPAVKKILLIAPSGDAGTKNIRSGLAKFYGEVYITVGDRDEIVGVRAGERFMEAAIGAVRKDLVIVPNCDHQFRGKRNGMILSNALWWAFCGDKTYPSPSGGIVLYQ
jgi:dienelactone hydrolase